MAQYQGAEVIFTSIVKLMAVEKTEDDTTEKITVEKLKDKVEY